MPRRKKEDEIPGERPPPRGAANARERTRMRVLSRAFGRLKLTLPWVPPDTKLSKLDTLRLATSYITHLKKVLTDDHSSSESSSFISPFDHDSKINLHCWPYGHHLRSNAPPVPIESPKEEPCSLLNETEELNQNNEYYFYHPAQSQSQGHQLENYFEYNHGQDCSLDHYNAPYDSSYPSSLTND